MLRLRPGSLRPTCQANAIAAALLTQARRMTMVHKRSVWFEIISLSKPAADIICNRCYAGR